MKTIRVPSNVISAEDLVKKETPKKRPAQVMVPPLKKTAKKSKRWLSVDDKQF